MSGCSSVTIASNSVRSARNRNLDPRLGVTWLASKLQQGGGRTSAGLGAFPASQPAGEIMDERGRRALHRGEIDVARRLAAGALDFQPRKAPVDRLSMVGDESIGSPSLHIRSFQLSQSSRSACCSIVSALARISADCAARMPVIARARPNSLARALRSPPERGMG
jgi:hypothetical protein